MPLVSFTRATLRSAEFGFFGVVVYTRVHTPRRCGLPLRAAVFCLATLSWRPLRTSCWIVGIDRLSSCRALAGRLLASEFLHVRPYPEVGRVAALPRSTRGRTYPHGFGRYFRRLVQEVVGRRPARH